MKKTRLHVAGWGLAITFLIALTGCATTPVERALSPATAEAARSATVFVIAPEGKLVADLITTDINVTGYGQLGYIVGAAVEDYENFKAYKQMEATLAPLRKRVGQPDYRDDLSSALQRSNLFDRDAKIIKVAEPPGSSEQFKALLERAAPGPVVVLRSRYMLDYSYQVLLAETTMDIRLSKADAEPVDRVKAIYYSNPVKLSATQLLSQEHLESMVERWMADDSKAFKEGYRAIFPETIAMLRTALRERPSNLRKPGDPVAQYTHYVSRNIRKKEAKTLHQEGDRAMVLSEDGTYLSIPTGPTYASAKLGERKLQPGKGRVFFYQPAGITGVPSTIYAGDRRVGEFSFDTVSFVDLSPGKYTFSLKYEGHMPGESVARSQIGGVTPLSVKIEAGRRYYVRFKGYVGIFTSDDGLRQEPKDTALPEVAPLWWVRR